MVLMVLRLTFNFVSLTKLSCGQEILPRGSVWQRFDQLVCMLIVPRIESL